MKEWSEEMRNSKITKFEELNAQWWANLFNVEMPMEPSEEPVIICNSGSKYLLQIIRNYSGYTIAADASLYLLIRNIKAEIDLKSITESPEGRERLRAYINTKIVNTPLDISCFYHAVGLACDNTTVLEAEENSKKVMRVKPGDEYWHQGDAPSEIPFKYAAIEDGKNVAEGMARRLTDFESTIGSVWAVGVGVRPEYRRRGYGRAVASAVTKECVGLDGVALWNAEIDNYPSLKICKSLGYREHSWYLFIYK
jgi:GNAT superfamily N-acetyltransferase